MTTEVVPFNASFAPLVAAWATSADELDRWASRRDHPLDPEAFSAWNEDPDVGAWMVLDDGELAAYGEVWRDPIEQEAELARLIVDPARRGRGLGVALVRELSASAVSAVSAGFDDVWVRVVPDNPAAIACYRRAGFVRTSSANEHGFNEGQARPYVWMRLRAA